MLGDTTSGAGAVVFFVPGGDRLCDECEDAEPADLPGKEVFVLVRRMAKQMHSTTLAQLASQISAMPDMGLPKDSLPERSHAKESS